MNSFAYPASKLIRLHPLTLALRRLAIQNNQDQPTNTYNTGGASACFRVKTLNMTYGLLAASRLHYHSSHRLRYHQSYDRYEVCQPWRRSTTGNGAVRPRLEGSNVTANATPDGCLKRWGNGFSSRDPHLMPIPLVPGTTPLSLLTLRSNS
jgi:hypothetical protein